MSDLDSALRKIVRFALSEAIAQPIGNTPNRTLDSASAVSVGFEAMKRALSTEDVIQMLRRRQGNRSQKELADELGVSQQYICDVYFRRREPGAKLLDGLGIVRRIVYEQVTQ